MSAPRAVGAEPLPPANAKPTADGGRGPRTGPLTSAIVVAELMLGGRAQPISAPWIAATSSPRMNARPSRPGAPAPSASPRDGDGDLVNATAAERVLLPLAATLPRAARAAVTATWLALAAGLATLAAHEAGALGGRGLNELLLSCGTTTRSWRLAAALTAVRAFARAPGAVGMGLAGDRAVAVGGGRDLLERRAQGRAEPALPVAGRRLLDRLLPVRIRRAGAARALPRQALSHQRLARRGDRRAGGRRPRLGARARAGDQDHARHASPSSPRTSPTRWATSC